jgi:hypothetical protein
MHVPDELEILKELYLLGIYSRTDLQQYGDFCLMNRENNEALYREIAMCSVLSQNELISLLHSTTGFNTELVTRFFLAMFNNVLKKSPESWFFVYKKVVLFINTSRYSYNQDFTTQLSIFINDYDIRVTGKEAPLNMPADLCEFLASYNDFAFLFESMRKMNLSDPSNSEVFLGVDSGGNV